MRKGFALISIIGAIVIVLFVGGVSFVLLHKTSEQKPIIQEQPQKVNQSPNSQTNIASASSSPQPLASNVSNYSIMNINSNTAIQFLVSDPKGLQTGINKNNQYVNEIPHSTYGLQRGIADDTGSGEKMPDVQLFMMDNGLLLGIYKIQITGSTVSPFRIEIQLHNKNNDPNLNIIKTFNGSITPGQVKTYLVDTTSGSINPSN